MLREPEGSQQVGEEKKELSLGQSHPNALSPAHEVRDKTLILDEFSVLNEAFRVELSWVCPVGWVVEDVVEECEDCGPCWDFVLSDLGRPVVHVGCADEVNGGDPHDLVDEGVGVGQPLNIRHCYLSFANSVSNLLGYFLL